MTQLLRKITAIVAGLLTFIVVGVAPNLWVGLVANIADKLTTKNTEAIFGNWKYDGMVENFYYLFLLGLALAVSLTVCFIIWDYKDRFRRRLLIYIPFMVIILCFSSYNYAHADILVRPDIQVIFNLVLVFLALVCLIKIWTLKIQSTDAQVLKYLIFFFLLLCGFCMPTFFTLLWLKDRFGLAKTDSSFNLPIVTTISGLITTAITVLKFRDDRRKEKAKVE